MRKSLALVLLALLLAVPASAQIVEDGPPIHGAQASSSVRRGGDPDQPEANQACQGCRAGAWWLCLMCSMQHIWDMGELP